MLNDLNQSLLSVKDIHWKIQDSTSSSVLFFKVNETSKQYLEQLDENKYQIIILDKKIHKKLKRSFVVNQNEWPKLQKEILDRLYPLPNLKMIGITGTNGKTTTTDLVLQIGAQRNLNGISIGTLGVREFNRTILDFGLTSPSFIDLRKYLHQYGKNKDFCVMEVSSHALAQERIYDIKFDAAGWVSFSQDHLDYHESMENYFNAKMKIFEHLKENHNIYVPRDQTELINKINKTRVAKVTEEISDELPLFFLTKFNRNNLEVAKCMLEDVFGKKGEIDYLKLHAPDGRFYIRPFKSNYIVVDFAHTPDALENICVGIKKAFPSHKLKILFGCGGNRDKTKRPQMGRVAETYSDRIYITSDNPRNEDADQIISDIISGIRSVKYTRITNRPEAVAIALSELAENEVLLLAGKGHENYILINGIKHSYSDIGTVEDFLKKAAHD